MLVGQRIHDVLGIAPPTDEPGAVQRLQPRRDRRQLVTFQRGQFADASLPGCQARQQSQPQRIGQRPKHLGSTLQLPPLRQPVGGARLVVLVLAGDLFVFYSHIP